MAGGMTAAQLVAATRRERIKQKLIEGGWTYQEIADDEGVCRDTIKKDIRAIKAEVIIAEAKEGTRLAFGEYSDEINWAVDEAKRLHEEEMTEDETGGRLDCLTFIVARKKEEIEMAQKLGLLEMATEKQEHIHRIDLDDPELIKKFGDFVATSDDT